MAGKEKSHRRSPCALACSLDIFGDKWTLLIVRDLMRGCAHFKEFEQSPEGIATNILSNRLARLVDHGLVERLPSPERAGRETYHLTPKGDALRPVLEAIVEWGKAQMPGAGVFLEGV
ncbi:MAG: helix-turn-helix domain-containing protein [Verrucomicrobiota bacterium]